MSLHDLLHLLTPTQLIESGLSTHEIMLEGFATITNIQVYWKLFETTRLNPTQKKEHGDVVEEVARLYSHILEYQARAICHLSKAQLLRSYEWNEWAKKTKYINDLSGQCRKFSSPLDQENIMRAWNNQLRQMSQSRRILIDMRKLLQDQEKRTQEQYEDQMERDLLRDLASNYEADKDFNSERVPKTCEWFLHDEVFLK